MSKKPTCLGRCSFFHWKKRWLQVQLNGHDGNEDMFCLESKWVIRNPSKLWGWFFFIPDHTTIFNVGGIVKFQAEGKSLQKKGGLIQEISNKTHWRTDPEKTWIFPRARASNLHNGVRWDSVPFNIWWNQGLRSAGKSGFSLWCGAQLNKVYRGGAHPWTLEACLVRRWNRSMADFFGGLEVRWEFWIG